MFKTQTHFHRTTRRLGVGTRLNNMDGQRQRLQERQRTTQPRQGAYLRNALRLRPQLKTNR